MNYDCLRRWHTSDTYEVSIQTDVYNFKAAISAAELQAQAAPNVVK